MAGASSRFLVVLRRADGHLIGLTHVGLVRLRAERDAGRLDTRMTLLELQRLDRLIAFAESQLN